MHDPEPRNDAADELALEAFLFAAGDLEDGRAASFLQRLADEQPAREALSQVVHAAGSLAGGVPVVPDPAYRAAVRDRLRPSPAVAASPAPRLRRGHPFLWLAAGAAAMYLLMDSLAWQPGPRPLPPVSAPAQRSAPAPGPFLAAVEQDGPAAATLWADLHTPDRLARVHDEEERRKSRIEDLHRVLNGDGTHFAPMPQPAR